MRRIAGLLAAIVMLASLPNSNFAAAKSTPNGVAQTPHVAPVEALRMTNVNADIITDTTWTLAGSPYIVGTDIKVITSAVLTVEPGVVVQFAQATQLTIQGRLSAVGTAAHPITFTGTTAQAGWWYGLAFAGTPSAPLVGSVLDYTAVQYGGRGGYGNVELYFATVNIAHSTIANSGTDGVHASAAGVAHIADSILVNNARYPIHFADGSVNPQLSNLAISGNGTNAIVFGTGTLTGQHVWRNLGVPYIFSNMTVAASTTLTVEAGVTAQFIEAAQLIVNGRLNAVGTAAQPITFTGTTAQAGWWYGLSFAGIPIAPLTGSVLDYTTVQFGGRGGYGNVELYFATVNIAHSTIANSGTDGVHASASAVAHIADSALINNARYPINYAGDFVDPILSDLTISGNGTNAIVFGGRTLTGQHVWRNLGVPYIFSNVTVAPEATLTVEPGVTVQFLEAAQLIVNGRLSAVGTTAQPITFTATTPQPGWWYGISASSSSLYHATVHLEHATIEYGGRGGYANLDVNRSQAFVSHGLIRFSGNDGIKVSTNSNASIEASQIVSNAVYGVHNTSADAADIVMAANNWWGAASGPTADGTCNPGGTGDRVSGGVAFQPVLTNTQQEPPVLAANAARILTMTPNRWFAPADNLTRIRLTLTLRDGNGVPLPGRKIQVKSSVGSVQTGGITDASGQTFAFITSAQVGDAELRATLDATSCETTRVGLATVTFTAPAAADDYLPEESAPYLNNGIQINPEPIIRGVPTRLSALMTNPNNFPIIVDGTFGFAQSGIGLVFGAAGEVIGQVIPANSTATVGVLWTPVVDGHYCVRFTYTARQASLKGGRVQAVGGVLAGGGSGRNLNIYPGPLGSPNEKDSLNKADNAFKAVSKIPGGPGGPSGKIVKGMLSGWWSWAKDTASKISKNLGGDPPRQDYQQIAIPTPITLPLNLPDAQVSPARAQAINEVTAAFLDMNAKGEAATITLDRYGGAGAAKNLEWTSLQAASLLYYKQQYALALTTAAMKIDALRQLAANEGVTTVPVTEAEIRAYQDRLRTTGFTAQEISDAKTVGLTDAEIEANKQDILAADPAKSATDVIVYLGQLADAFRKLSNDLINPPNFGGFSVSGGLVAGTTQAQIAQAQAVTPTNLVRVFNNVSTVQLANPLAQTAVIDLKVRRVDVPSDWLVTVSPVSITLAPGAQTTVTVTVIPGASAVQGSVARVAVEGYAGSTLLGGVVVDTLLPRYIFFDGKLHAHLPVAIR